MEELKTATSIIENLGGRNNIITITSCMTRLRISLKDSSKINQENISALRTVLGIVDRGNHSFEVVFGPGVIDGVYAQIIKIINDSTKHSNSFTPTRPKGSMNVQVSAGKKKSYAAQARANAQKQAINNQDADTQELEELCKMLDMQQPSCSSNAYTNFQSTIKKKRSLLVINGPNINFVGIREPEIYGTSTYSDIINLSKQAAREYGFDDCVCTQTNHEGEIIDEIQHAYQIYDAIVINPGAYSHTSIAIMDAIAAVGIPTVEVHLTDIYKREEFRHISYTSKACIKTIVGMGVDGYVQAVKELASYIDSNEL